jgi:hypothetical protein
MCNGLLTSKSAQALLWVLWKQPTIDSYVTFHRYYLLQYLLHSESSHRLSVYEFNEFYEFYELAE